MHILSEKTKVSISSDRFGEIHFSPHSKEEEHDVGVVRDGWVTEWKVIPGLRKVLPGGKTVRVNPVAWIEFGIDKKRVECESWRRDAVRSDEDDNDLC